MSESTPMERFQQLIDSMPDEPDDWFWDCPTCLRPMPPEKDSECGTCGSRVSHHLSVTSMCKIMRSALDREASLKVEVKRLLKLIDDALTQIELGGELDPDTRHELAVAVEGRDA